MYFTKGVPMKTVQQHETEATLALGNRITELEQELARATKRIEELELIVAQQRKVIKELS
jgi:uncharacterized coiled-coil protein SlyX